MASPFNSITCTIRWDNARIVSWTMTPGMNLPADFTLRVENSRAGGPWQVLATGMENSCAFIDTRKRNYNKRLNECYRLRLTIPSTHEEYVSDIVDAGNHKAYPYSADAENVLKQAEQAIKNSGCTGKLIKRKLWGVKCPDCVDFAGQMTVNEHCPRCLGTGIDGGYFPGIQLDIIKDGISTNEATAELGSLQGETVQARCIAYPWINSGDVWCEDNTNKRYVIDKITPASSYRETHLIYSITMHRVEYTDVLYSATANSRVVDTGAWESTAQPTVWSNALDEL